MRRWGWLSLGVLIGLLFATVSTAGAQPPRAGLCEGLSGDDLTRCLYSDTDDRLRQLGSTPSATPTPTPTPTSASPTPTPTPTPTQTSAPGWLSGAASDTSVSSAQFGTWRGSELELVATWVNDPALYPLGPKLANCGGCGQYETWQGAIDVAANVPDWQGWSAEASGVHDAFWRSLGKNLAKYRTGKGTTYLRIYHEYNGTWYPWSVKSADRAAFITAWQRTAGIIRSEFPAVKMMLGTAAANGYTVADAWPAGVDVMSVDFYNEWPWCADAACFDSKIENAAGANSLADLQRLAKAKGVPILVSEWASAGQPRAASDGGGGDAPAFMSSFYGWLKANAGTGPGQVLGEVYFNVPGYAARFEIYGGQAVQPKAAAEYRRLWVTN